MNTFRASLVLVLTAVTAGCGVDTTPPPIVGDRGDISGQGLKVGCTLSRSEILSSVSGGRRTAIERGFAWYDAKVPYSQSSQYDSYRTDCSGFVSMCWQLGTSYTTANFIKDTGDWTSLASFDDLVPADAMVYRKGGSGHIVMFVGWNDAAKTEACVLEQASTKDDMQFRARTTSSLVSGGYHAIRATKFGAGTGTGSGTGGSTGGECFCDAECSSNGDCCASCPGGTGGSSGGGSGGSGNASGSGGSGNVSGSGGSGNASGSGGSGGQCFCDSECVAAGDCCASCPNGTGGSSSGGSGGSGGSGNASGSGGSGAGGGQCFCDSECVAAGDCCASCPNGSGGGGGSGNASGSGGSGAGGGGGGGGACYCDPSCAQFGDCCSNC